MGCISSEQRCGGGSVVDTEAAELATNRPQSNWSLPPIQSHKIDKLITKMQSQDKFWEVTLIFTLWWFHTIWCIMHQITEWNQLKRNCSLTDDEEMRRAGTDGTANGTKRTRGASLEIGFGFYSGWDERTQDQSLADTSRGPPALPLILGFLIFILLLRLFYKTEFRKTEPILWDLKKK